MSKHTKGPWIADGGARVQGDGDGTRFNICHLDPIPPHIGSDRQRAAMLRGNANVLAASVDLLAAIRPVAAEIKEKVVDPFHDTWNPDAHADGITLTISECRAILSAIAKAEGRS